MAQAAISNVIHIENRDANFARAFRDMEGKLHDLVNMSSLACSKVEGFTTSEYEHSEKDRNITLFSVYHLDEMIQALLADWTESFKKAH